MRTKVCLLLVSLLFSTANHIYAVNGQAVDSATTAALMEINKIKMNPDEFIYSEVTMKDWQEAYETAKSLLKDNISSWLKGTQTSDIKGCIVKSDEKFLEIKARRGDLYRAFVYVKKSDIIPYEESRQMLTVDLTNPNEGRTEIKKIEIEKKSTINNNEKPAHKTVVNQTQKPAEIQLQAKYTPSFLEKIMLTITKSDEIKGFIKNNANDNIITQYGKYADRPKDGIYYLFVYNHEGTVPACLKYDNGKLTNVKTGQVESFENYKNCGAIWFIIK